MFVMHSFARLPCLRSVFFGGRGAMIRLLSRAAMSLALFLPLLASGDYRLDAHPSDR
jgi:hypothetical protein